MKTQILLLVLICSVVIGLISATGSALNGYYSAYDMLGPFSKLAPVFLIISFLIVLLLVMTENTRTHRTYIVFLPFILLFLVKYVIPDFFETSYATNFMDAPGHLIRGLYVAKTGFSNPQVDGYFALQPGFFWSTSVFLNLFSSVPSSLFSSVSLFLTKWFHVLIILSYLPLLYLLYKKLLTSTMLVGGALFLQFAIDIGHYHYAAQAYGYLLYLLAMGLLLLPADQRNRERMILLLICGSTLVFIHQGLTILLLVLMAACMLSPYIFKPLKKVKTGNDSTTARLWIPFAFVFSVWFAYLMFAGGGTLADFARTFQTVIYEWLTMGTQPIIASVERSYAPWMQIVEYKAIFTVVLLAAGLFSSFMNVLKSGKNVDKTVFTMQLLTVVVVGGISLPLSSTGYLERIFLISPLIAYSLVKFSAGLQVRVSSRKTMLRAITVIALAVLVLSGLLFYFSGRNFQSITYSQIAQKDFLVKTDPYNIAGLCTQRPISTLGTGTSNGIERGVLYVFSLHDMIYSSYYSFGSLDTAQRIYVDSLENTSQVYDSGTSEILILP